MSSSQQQRVMTSAETGRTTPRATTTTRTIAAEDDRMNNTNSNGIPMIHVLVVDDERICRAVTSQVLRKCGYRGDDV